MLLKKERKLITEYGLKLIDKDLTRGTGGNLSIYNRQEDLIAISPSGISYEEINLEDIVIINLEGKVIEGDHKPSSELDLHLLLYQKRDDIHAIIHTHPTYATTIACLNQEIPAVHYLVAYAGDKVPCAKYAAFGSKKLAKNVYKAIGKDYNASLMANHGLIALGYNIKEALTTTEMVEYTAEIYYNTKAIGEPKILNKKQMNEVMNKFVDYRN
jgi:L-fuculose-phosphate aldolase